MEEQADQNPEAEIKKLKSYLKHTFDQKKEIESELGKTLDEIEEKNVKIQSLEILLNEALDEKEKIAKELTDEQEKYKIIEAENQETLEKLHLLESSSNDNKNSPQESDQKIIDELLNKIDEVENEKSKLEANLEQFKNEIQILKESSNISEDDLITEYSKLKE